MHVGPLPPCVASFLLFATADEVASLAPMIRALSSEHAPLRLHAVEAMGRMGYLAAVEPLAVHLTFLQGSGSPPVGERAQHRPSDRDRR